jgi:hypothetical protein
MLRTSSLSGLAIIAVAACSDNAVSSGTFSPAEGSGSAVGDGAVGDDAVAYGGASTNDGGVSAVNAPSSSDSSSPMSVDSSLPSAADSGPLVPHVDAGLMPGVPPSKNFDLSVWSLTLPIGAPGSPTIISSAQLVAGYTSQYFFTGSDGTMTFWAPVTGVSTANSKYPRSELRENKNGANYDWSLTAGTSTLTASVAVTTLPPTKKIVVGQIHGDGPQHVPLIELAYTAGTIVAEVVANPNMDIKANTVLASAIGVGTVFDYSIQTTPGSMLIITVNGKVGYQKAVDASWSTQKFYFKAGSYVQDNTGTSTQGGQVAFYSLSIAHGP